jgi:hypothetical protein
VVHIPKEYINTEVEILVLPFSLRDNELKNNEDILKILANGPVMGKKEITLWESSIKNGYENWQIK